MPPESFLFLNDNPAALASIPSGLNHINYSRFRNLESDTPFRSSFSIKFVVKGEETYFIGSKKYEVAGSQYLVVSPHTNGRVLIRTKDYTEGLCIDLKPELIRQVLHSYKAPGEIDTRFNKSEVEEFLLGKMFMENTYNTSNTALGAVLTKITTQGIPFSEQLDICDEMFYQLAEALILDQQLVYTYYQSIAVMKSTTKKELLRRMLFARDYIDENFQKKFSCNELSKLITLSEFHFFRMFRAVFGLSPRQYIIQKRLEYAKHAICTEDLPVTDIAVATGFSDLQTFSKAFRKYFGYPPSALRLSKKQDLTTVGYYPALNLGLEQKKDLSNWF
ncbi:MAG TPA: AraC family transcriptional regulator [Niabella sp.]|nr:AraC family transcriptional regulator [Niabella sp.]